MSKMLVIVESPAKAATINKYLGKDYIVKSSVGHIRRLSDGKDKSSKDPKENLVLKLGVDPYHGWKAKYIIDEGKKKVVDELKFLAKKAPHVFLATDLDREGEAIAWHLKDVLGLEDNQYSRVVFNEITKDAILKAFQNPGKLNEHLVEAQKTRQFLDKVVGYTVSPVLWKKIRTGLSAGRVQSPAVRLVVEREQEIERFIPKEYWEIVADTLTKAKQPLSLQVVKLNGKELVISSEKEAKQHEAVLTKAAYQVDQVETKPTTSKPKPPFITSTLQQAASSRLGFGVKRTMSSAQKLYEKGYITYMRTDSTYISQDALNAVRDYIHVQWGTQYLPQQPNLYKAKSNAQEAHEAIRPTNCSTKALQLTEVGDDEKRLYNLIWSQFVASQMTPALYDSTTIQVQAGGYEAKAKGRVVVFDGWTKVLKPKDDENDTVLPEVKQGEVLSLNKIHLDQCFTKPPSRYNEASLVKELEKRGIGRPSTYATIITTIQDRGYVKIDNKRFFAEKIGKIVTRALIKSFTDLVDYQYTADLETTLDDIAEGKQDYIKVLDTFFQALEKQITKAVLPEAEGGMIENKPIILDFIKCKVCHRPMVLRQNGDNVFLGCSGYTDKANKCTHSVNLINEKWLTDDEGNPLTKAARCKACGSLADTYYIDVHRRILHCRNDICQFTEVEEGDFDLPENKQTHKCESCGELMMLKVGKFGKYYQCNSCKAVRGVDKEGNLLPPKKPVIDFPELPCKKKGAHFVLRQSANGNIFLGSNNFPKVKEMRPLYVDEAKRFKDRLPEELKYLADAPEVDNDGNPTFIRFDKFKQALYVMSIDNQDKPLPYRYLYENGGWVLKNRKES